MGFSSIFSSAFDVIHGTNNEGTRVYSLLSSNRSELVNNIQAKTIYDLESTKLEGVKEFLKNYHLVAAILNLFTDTIADVITRSSFNVEINNKFIDAESNKLLSKKINKFLDRLNLKDLIIHDLPEYLYWGNYNYFVDYKIDDEKVTRVINPHNVIIVEKYCEDFSCLSYLNNYEKDLKEINDNIVYCLNPKIVKQITEWEDFNSKNPPPSPEEQIQFIKENPFAKTKIIYSYKTGRGILDDLIPVILMYYVKEMLYDLLGLKDTLRSDILVANVADDKTDDSVIATAINDLEALVNDANSMSDSITDIDSLVSSIKNYLSNGIKVVPGLRNISNFNPLKLPELFNKKNSLEQDLNNLQKRLLSQVGIPEELFNGNANRWEALQRNSRFMTKVEIYLGSISNMIKRLAIRYVDHLVEDKLHKNVPHNLTMNDISINLETNTTIFNSYINSRAESAQKKMQTIQQLLDNSDRFMNSKNVDKEKAKDWITQLIQSVDPTAASLIDFAEPGSSMPGPGGLPGQGGMPGGPMFPPSY